MPKLSKKEGRVSPIAPTYWKKKIAADLSIDLAANFMNDILPASDMFKIPEPGDYG